LQRFPANCAFAELLLARLAWFLQNGDCPNGAGDAGLPGLREFQPAVEVFRSVSMKNMFKGFVRSEDGFLLSSEALLIGTIAVLGLLVGLVSVRDAVVNELGDFSQAIGLLNQSYNYTGVSDTNASTFGGLLADTLDPSDAASGTDAGGISLTAPASAGEGT